MKWDHDYTNPEVDDRRGEIGPGISEGGGVPVWGLFWLFRVFGWKGLLVGAVIAGVVYAGGAFSHDDGQPTHGSTHGASRGPAHTTPHEDELAKFVGFVFEDVQKTWRAQMPGYRDTRLELFHHSLASACGTASTAVGPFYCPGDREVYIDLAFYDELRTKLGAPGDFAQAYVIAHEVGHHIQNQLGLLGPGHKSVETELQADCLAGAWGKDANRRGELDVGDVDQALNAAKQIGDDTLQKKEQGYVQPETWTHGSSAQRVASFKRGFDGGAEACGVNFRR